MGKARLWIIPQDIELLPISRQRKLQMLWRRLGRCSTCGQVREEGLKEYCLRHSVIQNEAQRRRSGAGRRNRGKTVMIAERIASGALKAQEDEMTKDFPCPYCLKVVEDCACRIAITKKWPRA